VQKLDFNIGGVSMDKPINEKPKGRTIRSDEVRTVKLGAKGEKKMNRRCKKCGVADGHNSRTCLSVEENRVRLVSLANPRKKGVHQGRGTLIHREIPNGMKQLLQRRMR
jgi:hypothetical protein